MATRLLLNSNIYHFVSSLLDLVCAVDILMKLGKSATGESSVADVEGDPG